MKWFFYSMLMATVAAMGCGDGTGKAGGPGATNPNAKPPLIGQSDDTFTLSTKSATVKQGETAPSSVGIKRGTNFAQDVAVSFADLPKGVTADPAKPVIKSSAIESTFNLTASDDAMAGDYIVKVIGHPGTGGDATNQFTLTVGKKDTFTLSAPFWTTALKQSEAKAVTITISRDNQFDQDVTLRIDGLPKGVTAEPAGAVIKKGDKDVSFSLKADAAAPLGDFAVTIHGTPTKGAMVSLPFKFSIAMK